MDWERKFDDYKYALEMLANNYYSRDVIEKVERLTDNEGVALLFSNINPRHYLIENSDVAGWLSAALLTGYNLERRFREQIPSKVYEEVRELNSTMLQCAKCFTLLNILSNEDFAETEAIKEIKYSDVPQTLLLGSPFIWDNLYMIVRENYGFPPLNEVPEKGKLNMLRQFVERLLNDVEPGWENYGTVDNLLTSVMEKAEFYLKKIVEKYELSIKQH